VQKNLSGIIGRFIGYQFANVDYLSFLPAYSSAFNIFSMQRKTSCHFVFMTTSDKLFILVRAMVTVLPEVAILFNYSVASLKKTKSNCVLFKSTKEPCIFVNTLVFEVLLKTLYSKQRFTIAISNRTYNFILRIGSCG
jgi:hypothetical protein